jgi:hypothetical protein
MTILKKIGIRRQEGYLYFIDSAGDVSRVRFGNRKIVLREKIYKLGIKKNPAYFYYLTARGDVAMSPITQDGLGEL